MITLKSKKGDWSKTRKYLEQASKREIRHILERYAEKGVEALRDATPKDSGITASMWTYEVVKENSGWKIYWKNNNMNGDVNIALILQLGHGTGTGGYVDGIDYANPAMAPVFKELADEAWKEINK